MSDDLSRCRVRLEGKGGASEFFAAASDRILLTGLSQGFALPYECATGTCGACRAEIVSGTVNALWPEAQGVMRCKLNEILMCQCTPREDVVLKVKDYVPCDQLGALRADPPTTQAGRIVSTEMVDTNTMVICLKLTRPISFDGGGQFVLIEMPGIDGYRAYSPSFYGSHCDFLKLVIRRKASGAVTERLFEGDVVNTEIKVFGPLGKAYFRGKDDGSLLLAVGGSGIAVGMSIIEHALTVGHFKENRATLIFGIRTPNDAFFGPVLERYVQMSGNALKVIVAFSDGEANSSLMREFQMLSFTRGFVHEVVRSSRAEVANNDTAFVAGPPPMVEATLRTLVKDARLSPDRIRYDKFA